MRNSLCCYIIVNPGCDANPDSCDQECKSVDPPQWFECSCNKPYVLYDKLGAYNYYKSPYDDVGDVLRVNESCVCKYIL